MSWGKGRPLSFDPLTGIRETFYYDDDRDRFLIETTQDVDSILERNKAHQAMTDENERIGGDGLGRRVASIPLVLYFQLVQEGITRDQKAFKRWLNDPENRYFKTGPWRV